MLLFVSLAVYSSGREAQQDGKRKYAFMDTRRECGWASRGRANESKHIGVRSRAHWQERQACISAMLAHSSTTPEGTSPPCIDSSAWLLHHQHNDGMACRRRYWCGTSKCR